jgi:hypothetical protein
MNTIRRPAEHRGTGFAGALLLSPGRQREKQCEVRGAGG